MKAVAAQGRSAGGRGGGAALERATYSMFGMLNWIYGWYEPARHGTPHEVARTIHRIAMSGVIGRGPGAASLAATERHVERVAVRSPIHLPDPD